MKKIDYALRPLRPEDRSEFARSLYTSFNTWYARHGYVGDYFSGGPHVVEIFFDIYNDISPGHSVAAFQPGDGKVMGSCFYHPRETHVSLGIMSVHPDYFGQGVGKALLEHIIDYTESNGHDSLRLVGSAMNMDSFSLYNRAGFVPRCTYHDMTVRVPETGMDGEGPNARRVRPATPDDTPAMTELELQISGISRQPDFDYCIENRLGCFHAYILEDGQSGIDGFAIAIKHPCINMIGPLLARSEEDAAALLFRAFDEFKGAAPVMVVPMEKRVLVEQLYRWGARNVETHLCQVRGAFQPFQGVSLPSFLPETG